jgi:hypothetical protein
MKASLNQAKLRFIEHTEAFGGAISVYEYGTNIFGHAIEIHGDLTNIFGNASYLRGDVTNLSGDVSHLRGDATGIHGDATGIYGNFDLCELTDDDRAKGININDLINREERSV